MKKMEPHFIFRNLRNRRSKFPKCFLLIFSIVFFIGCGDLSSRKNGKTQEDSLANSKKERAITKCFIKSSHYKTEEREDKSEYKWLNGKITEIIDNMEKGWKITWSYKYNKSNQLEYIVTDFNGVNSDTNFYFYNKDKLIKRIETNKNGKKSFYYSYNYDNEGLIITETLTSKHKVVIVYKYYQDAPIEAQIFHDDKLRISYNFFYDNKINPFINLGLVNISRMMSYGYAVANYKHNLIKVITRPNENYYVNGKYFKKGSIDTSSISYEYNSHDYPITCSDGNTYEYDCNSQ